MTSTSVDCEQFNYFEEDLPCTGYVMKGLMASLLTLTVAIMLPITASGSVCPRMCSCGRDLRYSGTKVDCSKRSLLTIPSTFPPNTTTIILNNNNLTTVKNNSFESVKELHDLDLKKNQISHLQVMAFHGCEKLRYLDLSFNRLTLTKSSYPDEVFDMLNNLRWLDIAKNQPGNTRSYPERIFRDLKNIEGLVIDVFSKPIFGTGITGLHSLTKLVLYGGKIGDKINFTNSTFLPFSNTSLTTLYITKVYYLILDKGVFAPLKKLVNLSISYVKLGVKNALSTLSVFKSRNMYIINLHKVHYWTHRLGLLEIEDGIIKKSDIQYLANICVWNFTLTANLILYIPLWDMTNTPFAKCIRYLDLSKNNMYVDPVSNIPLYDTFIELQYVDFSHQVHVLKLEPRSISSALELANTPHPSNCKMHTNITIPSNLKRANVSAYTYNFGSIGSESNILNGSSLIELDASFIGLNKVRSKIRGLENLTRLDLSGNPDLTLSKNQFESHPSIAILQMSYFSFQQQVARSQGKQLLKSLSKLEYIHLTNNHLSDLPDDLFEANPLLQYLNLSRNIFDTVPINLKLTPKLNTLDLTYNSIRLLDKTSRQQIDSHIETTGINLSLYISGNMFTCGCGSLDFMFWIEETNAKLDDARNYTCLLIDGTTSNISHEIENSKRFWRKCIGVDLFYLSSTLFILMVAVLLIVLLVKTNKTTLLYHVLRIVHQEMPKPRRQSFTCDVYVSYAETDYQWICHKLCPELEKRNLSLFIWDRDSLPGDSIPDQIAEVIPQCWKILLYFTERFEIDPWMYMSMMAAINSVGSNSPERIILLLPENGHPRVPNCLLQVVPESCITRVPCGDDDNAELWDLIASLLKR